MTFLLLACWLQSAALAYLAFRYSARVESTPWTNGTRRTFLVLCFCFAPAALLLGLLCATIATDWKSKEVSTW